MAKWIVIYGAHKGERDSIVIEAPDKLKTAAEVREALVGGKIPDAVFESDAVLGVAKHSQPVSGGFRVDLP